MCNEYFVERAVPLRYGIFFLNKFYSASSNVLLLFYEHLSGRLNMFFRILRTYFSGKIFIRFDLCYYIWSAEQQEPDKESGALVDEVARQLERQALEEKERLDDDEGKWLIWFLWLGKQENMTFFNQSCLFVHIVQYSLMFYLTDVKASMSQMKRKMYLVISNSFKSWICWMLK